VLVRLRQFHRDLNHRDVYQIGLGHPRHSEPGRNGLRGSLIWAEQHGFGLGMVEDMRGYKVVAVCKRV
jgi:hypothetical protein